ncbi:MAG: 30S ribosomal protein S16 [Marinilabiliales bacterium]|nr:MAG: 30S ribosomal protein S16 [Marinilabiliales bacterium]
MPVKIRLTRKGRKRRPYYHIVVADGRAPRDGRLIERIGAYNPTTNPATIELDFNKALSWLQKGAQPTETCRAILSYEGVLMKKHLLDGVKKGAFDEATAESKFDAWKREKEGKIQAKIDRLAQESNAELKKRLDAESKINQDRAEAIAKKNAELAAEAEAAEAPEETPEAETETEVEAEAKTEAEPKAEEKTEAEPKAEEKTETEPKAEAESTEEKAGEEKAEEKAK